MSEHVRYQQFVSLDYQPKAEDVCGGVYVDAEERFVPVQPAKGQRHNGSDRYTLWEYQRIEENGGQGEIRACLLRTYPYSGSPTWHIMPGSELDGYYEQHRTVSGIGHMILEAIDVDGDGPFALHVATVPLPNQEIINVLGGDAFSIVQPNASKSGGQLNVLTTFSGAPFKPEYEEQL